jgi:ribosome-associated translation inhibitor RaiA
MIIQFNTDHNIEGREAFKGTFISLIEDGLSRFSSQITRIEAHLTDDDGNKDGQNDKRCVLEARLEGMQPIAVTNHANSHYQAVEGAIEKLKTSLETKIGRLSNY